MATLSSYALVSLADCKAFLDETGTDRDDLITRLINSQTKAIENYCGRKFASRSYVMHFNVTESDTLLLPNYPITAITRIDVGRQNAIAVTYSGSAANPRIATTDASGPTTSAPDASCSIVTCYYGSSSTAISTASATTLSSMITGIAAATGFSASLLYTTGAAGSHPSADIIRLPMQSAQSRTVYLEIPSQTWSSYRIDPDIGVVKFGYEIQTCPQLFQNVRVAYTGGYASVQTADETADLVQVCCELVQMALSEVGDNFGVKSESLGDFSQTFDGLSRSDALKERLAPFIDHSRAVA